MVITGNVMVDRRYRGAVIVFVSVSIVWVCERERERRGGEEAKIIIMQMIRIVEKQFKILNEKSSEDTMQHDKNTT